MDIRDGQETEEWAEQALMQVNKMITQYALRNKATQVNAVDTLQNIFDVVRVVCPMIQIVEMVKDTPVTE